MPLRPVALDIPFRTLLKLFTAALLAFSAYRLYPMMVLFSLSLLVAVTLKPIRLKLSRWMPKWLATTVVTLGIITTFALAFGLLVPALISQVTEVAKDWPRIQTDILNALPHDRMLHPLVQETISHPGISISGKLPEQLVTVGGMAVGGISELVLLLTFSIYLLVDGKRAYEWLLAFFQPETRSKLEKTASEVSEVISAYLAGQLITSLLVGIYAFALLSFLKVPGALMLAMLAAIFDILPIVGFFLSTVPAVLLALTVSSTAGLAVFGGYLFYHALENYYIVPKIYGDKLRLSTLVVLLSLLAGGMVAGIAGAILILPIVASYPIIERIWLRRYLGSEVVEKHITEDKATKSA